MEPLPADGSAGQSDILLPGSLVEITLLGGFKAARALVHHVPD